jgi:hypothetical protein
MRTLIVCLVMTIVGECPVFAQCPVPYIGGIFHVNTPTSDFARKDLTRLQGGAHTGIGQEVVVGMTMNALDAYAGFRWAHFDIHAVTQDGSETAHADGMWRLFRWTLGLRYKLLSEKKLSPTLGGGLTWARSDIEVWTIHHTPKLNTIKMSSPSLGWFAEGGAVLTASTNLDLLGGLQYHQYAAPIHSPQRGIFEGRVQITYVTVYAGLKIRLL